MKRLILGMGNEFCGNDAIGIIVAQKLREELSDWEVRTGAFTGIDFLEAIDGYEEVVVIDSIVNLKIPVGTVIEFKPEDFDYSKNFSYLHSMSFASALELGKTLKLDLPKKIRILGISVDKKGEVGSSLNRELKEHLSEIIHSVREKIQT